VQPLRTDDYGTISAPPDEGPLSGLKGLLGSFTRQSVMEPGFKEAVMDKDAPIDYSNVGSVTGGRLRQMVVDPVRNYADVADRGMRGEISPENVSIKDLLAMTELGMEVAGGGVTGKLAAAKLTKKGLDPNMFHAFPVFQGRSKKGLKEFQNPDGVSWGTTDKGTAEQFANIKESYFPNRQPPETVREMRGEVYDLDFDIKKPMDVDISETLWKRDKELAKITEAKAKGFDGLRINHPSGKIDYVAFDGSQVTKSLSQKFKKWFVGSKAVDDKGEPFISYHGAGVHKEITEFEPGRSYVFKDAIWFSPKKQYANTYASKGFKGSSTGVAVGNEKGHVIPVYLSVKNPIYASSNEYRMMQKAYNDSGKNETFAKFLYSKGYDAFIPFEKKGKPLHKVTEIAVFKPTQIKSIFNRGTYNPNDPNILRSSAGVPTGITGLNRREDNEQ